mmetsp:Transcript_15269/g.36258  ORF Transcript_15269/g.36258 Transcript_15269/m.36258 type:complete len:86 (-) Transcript_15269:208-465(-)
MCSYNAVNGVPACGFMAARHGGSGRVGFDGYIASDCDADGDIFAYHHWTKTPEENVRDVLRVQMSTAACLRLWVDRPSVRTVRLG